MIETILQMKSQGFTYKEIGAVIGITHHNVGKKIYRYNANQDRLKAKLAAGNMPGSAMIRPCMNCQQLYETVKINNGAKDHFCPMHRKARVRDGVLNASLSG